MRSDRSAWEKKGKNITKESGKKEMHHPHAVVSRSRVTGLTNVV